jgi:hypothetical protein
MVLRNSRARRSGSFDTEPASEEAEIVQREIESDPTGIWEPSTAFVVPSAAAPTDAIEAPTVVVARPGKALATQPEPALAATSLIGSVDRVDPAEISGWAWDPACPDVAVEIEILDDDVVVLKICADQLRSDLVQAGAGSGRHGFFLKNLAGVFPLSRHRVRVRRAADGIDLPGSPAWITRPTLDYRAADFMQQVMLSTVRAATSQEDLAEPLSHLLRLLNDLINAQTEIARAQSDLRSISPVDAAAALPLTGQTPQPSPHSR